MHHQAHASLGALLVLTHVIENLLAAHGADALLVGAGLTVETWLVEVLLAHLASSSVGIGPVLATKQFVLPDLPPA